MPRLLFEKKGNAIWISHLDLMRLFQRAFKRAGLQLTHTQGFNPRPSVSIALPLSVGIASGCELLDFDLVEQNGRVEDLVELLNAALTDGIRVLKVYDNGRKIRELSLLSSCLTLEYDNGVPERAKQEIQALFQRASLLVEKKTKSGIQEQDIIPMIRSITLEQVSANELQIRALACCQNPTLNPMQLDAAIRRYLPQLQADFVKCERLEIYDADEKVFR